jgi:hypothetical protein
LRTLLIGAMAATLVGCSRQLPPQAGAGSCTGASESAFLEPTARPPISLATFGIDAAPADTRTASAKTEKSPSADARQGTHLAGVKPNGIPPKADLPASHVPLPRRSPKARLQPAGNPVATESQTARPRIAQQAAAAGPGNSGAGMIEAQVVAATALAERMTVASAAPDSLGGSGRPEGVARGTTDQTEAPSARDAEFLVAVLMARADIKSASDLTGKTIAIDDRYSASNRSVRTAIVAAGAPEVEISEGRATAINRLLNGEVPAAILALVSAEAAGVFREIEGYNIFRIPLSPRSLKVRP